MKKSRLLILTMALLLTFSACSHYTCPTYDNQSGEQKYSGGKKSKPSSGLGMP
jgi:hypothetical protein